MTKASSSKMTRNNAPSNNKDTTNDAPQQTKNNIESSCAPCVETREEIDKYGNPIKSEATHVANEFQQSSKNIIITFTSDHHHQIIPHQETIEI